MTVVPIKVLDQFAPKDKKTGTRDAAQLRRTAAIYSEGFTDGFRAGRAGQPRPPEQPEA
jgi:hypothetical protein